MLRRFFVVAKKWSEEDRMQINYIVAEFLDYNNAYLFKEAYNNEHKTDAHIIDEFNLLNPLH